MRLAETVPMGVHVERYTDELEWQRDGPSWPLHDHSQFIDAGGPRWHVQQLGQGPTTLLIHGAGSSAHSWHRLAPLLAAHSRVIVVDLPGHGFTRGEPACGMSPAGISRALATLLTILQVMPSLIVGHSAGAAIAVQMTLDRLCQPRGLVSLNGVLVPFDRRYQYLFSPLAKVLTHLPFVPLLFSCGARDRAAVERLIESTGSRLDPFDVELYRRLVRSPAHVAGALRMMASWDLASLASRLPALSVPLVQLVALRDRTVPPEAVRQVLRRLPTAAVVEVPNLGHLAHEERPDTIATLILQAAGRFSA